MVHTAPVALALAMGGAARAAPADPGPEAVRLHDAVRRRTDRRGMSVLGGWAVGNMAVGGVGAAVAEDPRWRGFHIGNLGWNTVNLGIASLGLAGGARQPAGADWPDTLLASHRTRVVLAVNAGIDIAYITAGAWLRQRGIDDADPMRAGLGEAVALNGIFLLGFDATMLALHGRNDRRLLRPWVAQAGRGGQLGFTQLF